MFEYELCTSTLHPGVHGFISPHWGLFNESAKYLEYSTTQMLEIYALFA